MRTGAVQLDEQSIVDATTRRTLSDTTMALDRDKLLREIEALRGETSGALAAASAPDGEAE